MAYHIKDIKNFEGIYAITDDGKVWSYPKKYGKYISKGKYLKNKRDKEGYQYIILTKPLKKQFTYKVHRLVAQTYIKNPKKLKEVNHKNGIKTDNKVENLEWMSRKENANHASINHLMKAGENHHKSKISDTDIKKIRELYSTKKYFQWEIAKMFNIKQANVSRIVNYLTRNTYVI